MKHIKPKKSQLNSASIPFPKGIQKLDGKAMKGIRGGLVVGVEDVIPS